MKRLSLSAFFGNPLLIITIALAAAIQASAGSYSPAPGLPGERANHTQILLNDGTVLVRGGTDTLTNILQNYIFDPNLGTYSPTGPSSLQATGSQIPYVLMPDGRVMSFGRVDINFTAHFFAETYDPAGRTFTLRNETSFVSWATANLLSNGRILVTGNSHDTRIYDPFVDTFFTGPDIPGGDRSQHVAVRLNDGRVLILGGGNQSRADIFDPVTGQFTRTADMSAPRMYFGAVVLSDGKVLVVGGQVGPTPLPPQSPALTPSAEIYDPAIGIFYTIGSMTIPRQAFSLVALPNGGALVTSGFTFNPMAAILANGEVYDSATGQWTLTDDMSSLRAAHASTTLPDGRVFISGGVDQFTDYSPVASADFFTGAQVDPCAAQLAAANATIQGLQTQIGTLTNDLASCQQAGVALQQDNQQLSAQIAALQADKAALTQQLASANGTIQTLQHQVDKVTEHLDSLAAAFASEFNDPQFTIKGNTPAKQLKNLVDAILQLNAGQQKALYKNLK